MAVKGQSPSQRLNSNTALALGTQNGAILIQDENGTLGGINPPTGGQSVLSFNNGVPVWTGIEEILEIPAPSPTPAVFSIVNGAFQWVPPQSGPKGDKGDKGDQGIQGLTGPAGPMQTIIPTQPRADFGSNEGNSNGFYENDGNGTNLPIPGQWSHLIECRHSNPGNNFALQIAGSFFDQRLFYRKTANNGGTLWQEISEKYAPNIEARAASNPGFQWHKPGVYGAVLNLDSTNWLSTQGWSAGGGFTSMRVGNLQVNGGLYFPDGSVQTTAGTNGWSGWFTIPGANASQLLRFRISRFLELIQFSMAGSISVSGNSVVIGQFNYSGKGFNFTLFGDGAGNSASMWVKLWTAGSTEVNSGHILLPAKTATPTQDLPVFLHVPSAISNRVLSYAGNITLPILLV